MADLSFSQAERRSYTVPALIAFAILAIAGAFLLWRTPLRTGDLTVTHAATLPTHTVFATDTKLVGVPQAAEDAFYVLATIHIHNRLHVPLFINGITGTLIQSDDSGLTASAIAQSDLPNLYITFPKLKPLSSASLPRDAAIPPGSDAEGMVIFTFPVAPEIWARRQSATVTVDFQNQGTLTADIPK